MSTWKKVLLEGADITGSDFAGNSGDLVAGDGISLGGTIEGVLLGAAGADVTVNVDINGQSDLGTSPATDDFILVYDTSEAVNSQIKKVSISNLSATFDSGVSAIQLTADNSTNTGTADTGSVVFNLEGGTGITTTGSDGKVTIAGSDASTSAKGIASFSSDNFAVNSGVVTIKDGGITNDEIVDGTIAAGKLAGSIGDTLLSTIATNNKVSISALNIDGGTAANALQATDGFIIAEGNADGANKTSTIAAINTYVGANAAAVGTVHNGIAGATDITGTGIGYIQSIEMDTYGHVTSVTAADIQAASGSVAGVVTTGTQTFGGAKTFSAAATFSSDLTVTGNLVVQGTTTTVDSTTVEVADKAMLLAALDSGAAEYANTDTGNSLANAAANGGGIVLESHSRETGDDEATQEAKFAALTWSSSGNLTGWQVRDTAVYAGDDPDQDAPQTNFDLSVMAFKAGAAVDNTDFGAGEGSFLLDTSNDELYVRVA